MSEEKKCAYCGDPIEGEGVLRGSQLFCSDACAYEGVRAKDCAGRTDVNRASLEEEMEYRKNPPIS